MIHPKPGSPWRRTCLWALAAGLAAAAMAVNPSAAARETVTAAVTVSVDCTGTSLTGAFTSIASALATLDPGVPNTILLTGDCHNEGLQISDFFALTIRAAAPGSAVISQDGGCDLPGPAQTVLHVVNSRGFVLDGVTLRGGGIGLDLTDSYGMSLRGVTIENGRGPGIAAGEGSTVTLQGRVGGVPTPNLIQNNCGPGLSVDASSAINVANGNATIQHNGMGVNIVGGRLSLGAAAPDTILIQNNAGVGIRLFAGGHLSAGRQTIVQNNNGAGIWAAANAIVDAGGGIQVLGNAGPGIHAQLNSTVLFGPIVNPAGTTNVVINGNTEEGLRLGFMSLAQSFMGVTMSGNGGADATCDGSSFLFGNITGITKNDCKNTDLRNK